MMKFSMQLLFLPLSPQDWHDWTALCTDTRYVLTDWFLLCTWVMFCLQLGHQPQEDYPEAIQATLEAFLAGETDSWPMGKVVASKMTKKGVVDG
jgi:hypothetical protein